MEYVLSYLQTNLVGRPYSPWITSTIRWVLGYYQLYGIGIQKIPYGSYYHMMFRNSILVFVDEANLIMAIAYG